jgi:hypothetical protein
MVLKKLNMKIDFIIIYTHIQLTQFIQKLQLVPKKKFHVFGQNLRDDFRGAKTTWRVGSCIDEGEVISEKEMECYFDILPIEHVEFVE